MKALRRLYGYDTRAKLASKPRRDSDDQEAAGSSQADALRRDTIRSAVSLVVLLVIVAAVLIYPLVKS